MQRLLDLPIRIGHGGHGPSFDARRMREIATGYLRRTDGIGVLGQRRPEAIALRLCQEFIHGADLRQRPAGQAVFLFSGFGAVPAGDNSRWQPAGRRAVGPARHREVVVKISVARQTIFEKTVEGRRTAPGKRPQANGPM
jgi:hypothetical protein